MSTPLCPNCREHMSSVELGLGGVWSCLYCEGTWLPSAKAQTLAANSTSEANVLLPVTEPLQHVVANEMLACPACKASSLHLVALQNAEVHRCLSCEGVFFKRGVLQALSPRSFSAGQEAPVLQALAGTFGSFLLGDPVALLVALQYKSAGKNAP
jgi:Zn-finger nucleic acid-binding protein